MARALRDVGAAVEIHDDHFPADAKDEDWLLVVGERGWAVLTKDSRIRYRAPALAAMARFRIRAFVLTAGDLQGVEMGAIFARALPAIARFAARHSAPFIARVSRSGGVSMLRPAKQFRAQRQDS